MQTEVRTKANTIEKNRNVVKTAQALVASMNPEGLSSTDWRIDMTRKLQERIDLQQQRDKLPRTPTLKLCLKSSSFSGFSLPKHLLKGIADVIGALDKNLLSDSQGVPHGAS